MSLRKLRKDKFRNLFLWHFLGISVLMKCEMEIHQIFIPVKVLWFVWIRDEDDDDEAHTDPCSCGRNRSGSRSTRRRNRRWRQVLLLQPEHFKVFKQLLHVHVVRRCARWTMVRPPVTLPFLHVLAPVNYISHNEQTSFALLWKWSLSNLFVYYTFINIYYKIIIVIYIYYLLLCIIYYTFIIIYYTFIWHLKSGFTHFYNLLYFIIIIFDIYNQVHIYCTFTIIYHTFVLH